MTRGRQGSKGDEREGNGEAVVVRGRFGRGEGEAGTNTSPNSPCLVDFKKVQHPPPPQVTTILRNSAEKLNTRFVDGLGPLAPARLYALVPVDLGIHLFPPQAPPPGRAIT